MRPRADITEWLIVFAILFFIAAFAELAKAETIEEKIVASAIENDVDPALAVAIARVESNLNPEAVGALGEIGVFQLRPEFHTVSEDEARNIETAVRFLAELKARCSNYGEAYFICFNLGHVRRVKHPTRFPYYRKVMSVLADGAR